MGKLFNATYWNGSEVAISSNGESLTMTDNSNYEGETGTATGAAPANITLASDAAGDTTTYYNGMSVLIITGTGIGSTGVVPSTGSNFNTSTKILSVVDWLIAADPISGDTYEVAEQGHHKGDFSTVRKVNISLPDASTYLLSTLGDGDANTAKPSVSTLPISDVHIHTTGDGVFEVKLTVVPDYNALVAYSVGHTVYYGGVYYICIQSTTVGLLPSDMSYWTAVVFDDISVKYTDDRKFYIDYDLRKGRITAAYKARNTANFPSDIDRILSSRSFKNWQILDLIIESMGELVDKQAWDEITHDINYGKTIIAYNE